MQKLLIKLTPLEPYFFGGERIFEIGDGNKHYFIRSLDTPLQTTLFGALRYIGIKYPSKGFYLDNDDITNIGKTSFKLGDKNITNFGRIKSISPLYIYNKENGFFIRTPFDHRLKCNCGEMYNTEYTPFKEYSNPIKTNINERCLPTDYNAKDGLADSWIALKNSQIYDDLFKNDIHVGVNKVESMNGFFKKEYRILSDGFCFAFFAEIMEGFLDNLPCEKNVYLGHGKSAFHAEIELANDMPAIPKSLFRENMLYAQSDIYIGENIDVKELYAQCFFVSVKTRNHRVFVKNNLNRKNSKNIKLIAAGSVFWPKDITKFMELVENPQAAIAGFNQIIIGGKAQ